MIPMRFVLGINALGLILCALAQTDGNNVSYPVGYRRWAHVKSTLIGPQHPRYESNGGLHHFYANDKALEGYRTGKFPDGAVLVDDLFELIDKGGGVTSEAARRRIAVMAKDSARYRDTSGWGFEVFKGDDSNPSLNAAGKAACVACHGERKAHDFVYSQYRN